MSAKLQHADGSLRGMVQHVECQSDTNSRSQFATLKQGQNIKYLSFAHERPLSGPSE